MATTLRDLYGDGERIEFSSRSLFDNNGPIQHHKGVIEAEQAPYQVSAEPEQVSREFAWSSRPPHPQAAGVFLFENNFSFPFPTFYVYSEVILESYFYAEKKRFL